MDREFTEEELYFIEEYKDIMSEEEILDIISIFDDETLELD